MNIRKLLIGFLIGVLFTSTYGSDIQDVKEKISELIREVKEAPPSERYKKMNKLKLFVKKLKAEERIKVMKKLHKQLHSGNKEMHYEHKSRMENMHQHMNKEHMEMRNMKESHKMEIHKKEHEYRKHEYYQGDRENKKGEHKWKWNHNR